MAAGASLALFGLSTLLGMGITWMWTVTGQRMILALATDLFARMQRLSLSFHLRNSLGDSLSRLMNDTWAIYKVSNDIIIGPAQRYHFYNGRRRGLATQPATRCLLPGDGAARARLFSLGLR